MSLRRIPVPDTEILLRVDASPSYRPPLEYTKIAQQESRSGAAMSERRPLHRLFGLSRIDFFQGTPIGVETEPDLSLK
jgi:hypothetical protein